MCSDRGRLKAVLCIAVSICCVTSYVGAAAPAEDHPAVGSIEQLPAVCRAAKAEFVPVGEADVQDAKAALLRAVHRLDARLAGDPNGQGWRVFLRWETMEAQLASQDAPDLAVLEKIYTSKYSSGHYGLGLVWFADVRLALRRYLYTLKAIGDAEAKTRCQSLLEDLAGRLAAQGKNPTAENALAIELAVGYLEDIRRAEGLVAAIKTQFCRPNLYLELSDTLVDAAIARDVDETASVVDVILKTEICGSGHTTGRIKARLVPDTDAASVELLFRGVNNSENVGSHGPVRIYSRAVTQLEAAKRLRIDTEGIHGLPATSEATASTTIEDVRSVRGRRLVERLAWKRVCRDKAKAEWVGSRHAEQRVGDRFDAQVEKLIAEANRRYADDFRGPLWEHKLLPRKLRFSTTRDTLRVTALQAGGSQLAADSPPPPVLARADLAIRVHESAINNAANSKLAGMTLGEEQLLATITRLLGRLPEKLTPNDQQEPWAISFARRRPVSVSFSGDRFGITLRARRFFRGETRHVGMNVSVNYKIEESGGSLRAIRHGRLEIFPPGFVPGSGKRLSARQQSIRHLLERRFEQIFERELMAQKLTLPDKWGKVGELSLVQWETAGGWLVMAWRRTPSRSDTQDSLTAERTPGSTILAAPGRAGAFPYRPMAAR